MMLYLGLFGASFVRSLTCAMVEDRRFCFPFSAKEIANLR